MKKIKYIILILILSFVYSCSDDNNSIEEKQYLTFNFNTNNKSNEVLEIEVEIISYNPIKLKSEFLREVNAINELTGEEVYGYVLIQNTKSNGLGGWSEDTGYFFDGECFQYGTMITGDNGNSMFLYPDVTTQYLHPDVCPGHNEAFV
ncbi:MAG: hypothetical protein V3U80_04200 [Flavobacteriaceae bacterium]